MASSRDAARLRQGLNPLLTTALSQFNSPTGAQPHQPQPTPISAVSMTSSHYLTSSSIQTPIQPYNPQEWVNSPATTMSERHFSPSGGDSGVSAPSAPLPPPPYSPPRSLQGHPQQRPVSTAFEHFSGSSTPPPPLPRLPSGSNFHRPSPEQTTTNFPPPPGLVGRGASRERRFGLSSLTRRRETDSNPASPPDLRQTPPPLLRLSSGASSIHTPEPYRPNSIVFDGHVAPPAARRAASAGAIETPTSARSRSTSQSRWEPGMPVPPPPPGPPPATARSQSVQPMDMNQVPIISPPTRRPPPSSGSALGPVPPTPAGWEENNSAAAQHSRGRSPALKIDTEAAERHGTANDPNPSSSSASSLSRTKAVRHDKTIMQRRAESKTRHSARGSIDERTLSSRPENIVIPSDSDDVAGRLHMTKLTPKTGDSSTSHNSTPRASSKRPMAEAATPPFSPYPPKLAQRSAPVMGGTNVPKSLPTPPPQVRSASGSRPREASRPPSRAPSRPPSTAGSVSRHIVVAQSAEQFATAAVERFQAFAATEALAETDAGRIRLFADFFVHESMIRRERYHEAIGAMGSEIFDLTRDLFQPLRSSRRPSAGSADEWTPASTTEASASHRGSMSSFHGETGGPSSSAPTSAGVPLSPSAQQAAGTGTWASNYMPSLSPILSMSVSDNYENGSSRGRPPSRWWETTSQGEAMQGFARSKRESKYMGVPKDQWEESFAEVDGSHTANSEHASSSDYPPEKTGWHEDSEADETPQLPQSLDAAIRNTASPRPPDSRQLDVSRLVTMPPPYPRHHPALNNSHPELAAIRASVRTLTDVAELDSTKEMYTLESSRRRDDFAKASADRQRALRANLQTEINSGNLGYADAAAIESDLRTEEHTKKKELEKSEYEHFQNRVILPMSELLSGRISRATDLFDDLSRKLFDNGQNDADMPQEEGDDRPELLEKLTLLKWIFEARETLHKATFDLLSDRNCRYRDVVLLPYQLSGNTEKLKSAEVFFADDAAKREYAFAHEVLNRVREFRGVVEEAVGHGVAMQLSAFWDIAPPLSQVLESIPLNLAGFSVQIPTAEYEENPAYRAFPLQYLYSLLLHAEKSTYQFIESHTNLLCLLHEVKEAVVHAKARVLATQVEDDNGVSICSEDRDKRARAMRKTEEKRLTEDLKEKVRVVQDQWKSGLGDAIVGVKARTGQYLLETGGWDEALEDGGVGSV